MIRKYRYLVTFRDKEQKVKFQKACKAIKQSMYSVFRKLIDGFIVGR